MTFRIGGPLVGALVGLAAAALGAVFLTGGFDAATLGVAAGSVLVAAAVAVLTTKTTAPQAAPFAPGPQAVPVQQSGEPARAAQAVADRSVLVESCIWMRDRATSPALARHLDGAFARVGVAPVDATGQRFDPAVHEAGSTVAARGPADEGIIARTEQIGYTDRGRLLRHPVVTVYRGQVRA